MSTTKEDRDGLVANIEGDVESTRSKNDDGVSDAGTSEEVPQNVSLFCHPSSRVHRYIVLFFMCMLTFGSYYCYDGPTSLEDIIRDDMGVSETQYNLLFSFYSWPNTVLCLVGGFLLDRVFGVRWGAVIFAAIICVGQVLFALGGIVDQFWLMCLGRFVFGIGGESLAVAQNTYSVVWFKGKELNTVFGLQLSISRLGSVGAMKSMPYLYNATTSDSLEGHTRLGYVLLLAALAPVFSLLSAFVMVWFDARHERLTNRRAAEGDKVVLSDILRFPVSFWLLCILCIGFYAAVFPMISNSVQFLQDPKGYNYSKDKASWIAILPYTISAIASPIFGIICDITGINLTWSFIAVVLTLGCHMAFLFKVAPLIPMIVLGLTIAMFASSFWPMCAFVVRDNQLGTAYGTLQAIQNLGLAIVFPLVGVVIGKFKYFGMSLFFMGWLTVGVAVSIGLFIVNYKRPDNLLNPPVYRERLACCRANEDTGIAPYNPIMDVST